MKSAWLADGNGGWVNAKYVVAITPAREQPGVWHAMAELERGQKIQLTGQYSSHGEAIQAISDLLDGIL